MGGILGDHRAVRPRCFPALVAVGSLALALLLFLESTVPALKERQELQQREADRMAQKRQLTQETTAFALRRTALSRDIQTLLLELDRQGIYPRKLLDELRKQARKPDGPQ